MLGLLVGGSQALLVTQVAGAARAIRAHALQMCARARVPRGAFAHETAAAYGMRLHMESSGPLQATNHKHRDFTLT